MVQSGGAIERECDRNSQQVALFLKKEVVSARLREISNEYYFKS